MCHKRPWRAPNQNTCKPCHVKEAVIDARKRRRRKAKERKEAEAAARRLVRQKKAAARRVENRAYMEFLVP